MPDQAVVEQTEQLQQDDSKTSVQSAQFPEASGSGTGSAGAKTSFELSDFKTTQLSPIIFGGFGLSGIFRGPGANRIKDLLHSLSG